MPDPPARRLIDLTDPEAVRAAMREFDGLGGIDAFLAAHPGLGLEPSRRYFIEEHGRRYDAAPVCAVAHGIQHPDRGPLTHDDLGLGGGFLARYLRALGFTVVNAAAPPGPRDIAWAREEMLLIADLYVNGLGRRRAGAAHPEVVALSTLLRRGPWHDPRARRAGFRSPASIVYKLVRLQDVDPDGDPLPPHLRAGSRPEREILLEYRHRDSDLASEAAALRAALAFPAPAVSPEIAAALADTARAAGRPAPPTDAVDPAARDAIGDEAMRRAAAWLASDGWAVEDVSASRAYDLHATRGAVSLHVTVKGTAGAGSDVLLAPEEVRHARERYPDTALFVVHSLRVVHGPDGVVSAVRGAQYVVRPWRPADASLTATGWCHAVNQGAAVPV